jgi:hypothetical protein
LATAAETEALKLKVKKWPLKKMAQLFNNHKKKLYNYYIKKKTPPEFTGPLEKQRDNWEGFLEYKESTLALERSRKNKANAAKKIYHHKMGSGGYKTLVPEWDNKDTTLIAKGAIPATQQLPPRARNWFLGNGGYIDEQTGELVAPPTIVTPKNELVKEVEEGKFNPDRERDVLTKALGNAEHTGRTRGLGPNYPWSIRFAEDVESYRKRERGRKRKEEEEKERIKKLEEKYDGMFMSMQKQIQELRQTQAGQSHQLQLEGPAFDSNDGPSTKRSSVASTGLGADEAPMGRYAVNEIKGKTHCELYQSMKNISMKVVVGYALPIQLGVTWHSRQIPDGYARVGVDEVLRGYESLELDIARPEDEAMMSTHASVLVDSVGPPSAEVCRAAASFP